MKKRGAKKQKETSGGGKMLEKLFDSDKRMRIIKFFVRNAGEAHLAKDVAKKLNISAAAAKKHAAQLSVIGFLTAKRSGQGVRYGVNSSFPLFPDLENIIIKTTPSSDPALTRKFQRIGKVKLAVLSGVFLNSDNARVDVLLVGDGLQSKKIRTLVSDLEAQVGKELKYTTMNSEEFKYRFNMYDRFVRDILDRPHYKVVNHLKI